MAKPTLRTQTNIYAAETFASFHISEESPQKLAEHEEESTLGQD
jgi:hypothetical protein